MNDKLVIPKGNSEVVTLSFDQPKTGTNANGEWYLYGVNHGGSEKSFFASEKANEKLVNYNKGDTVKITHVDLGDKSVYNVEPTQGMTSTKDTTDKPDWDAIASGKVRHGFALEAYSQGKELTEDTMAEVEDWVDYVMNGRKAICHSNGSDQANKVR